MFFGVGGLCVFAAPLAPKWWGKVAVFFLTSPYKAPRYLQTTIPPQGAGVHSCHIWMLLRRREGNKAFGNKAFAKPSIAPDRKKRKLPHCKERHTKKRSKKKWQRCLFLVTRFENTPLFLLSPPQALFWFTSFSRVLRLV